MFESTIKLFGEYALKTLRDGAIPQSMDEPPHELASEVIERLRQLHFIVERVRTLEASADGVRTPDVVYLEMRTLTEAFSWVASRVQTVLRSGALPGLESFECAGSEKCSEQASRTSGGSRFTNLYRRLRLWRSYRTTHQSSSTDRSGRSVSGRGPVSQRAGVPGSIGTPAARCIEKSRA